MRDRWILGVFPDPEEGRYAYDRDMTKVNARDLRVSDDDREHVVGLLQRAIGRGLIDLEEFTTRTDTALAASTRSELNAVLIDLPGMVHRDYQEPRREPEFATNATGETQRMVLSGKYSKIIRDGRWSVPRELVVRNKYGSAKLDFSEACFAARVVHVELDAKWTSVEVIVPEGASVSTDSIGEIKYGSLEDKTNSGGRSGSPHIVFSGYVHGGALKIRHPRRGWLS